MLWVMVESNQWQSPGVVFLNVFGEKTNYGRSRYQRIFELGVIGGMIFWVSQKEIIFLGLTMSMYSIYLQYIYHQN